MTENEVPEKSAVDAALFCVLTHSENGFFNSITVVCQGFDLAEVREHGAGDGNRTHGASLGS